MEESIEKIFTTNELGHLIKKFYSLEKGLKMK